jgi:hypothetical protein
MPDARTILSFLEPSGDVLAVATTQHWFNPCELPGPNARSEYREEFRERQCGGGWLPRRTTTDSAI